MKESTRSMMRTLSGVSAGVGMILALGVAGTTDYRDALQYDDEEVREMAESTIASEKEVEKLSYAAFVALGAGAIGLALTEKKSNQR